MVLKSRTARSAEQPGSRQIATKASWLPDDVLHPVSKQRLMRFGEDTITLSPSMVIKQYVTGQEVLCVFDIRVQSELSNGKEGWHLFPNHKFKFSFLQLHRKYRLVINSFTLCTGIAQAFRCSRDNRLDNRPCFAHVPQPVAVPPDREQRDKLRVKPLHFATKQQRKRYQKVRT